MLPLQYIISDNNLKSENSLIDCQVSYNFKEYISKVFIHRN